MSTFCHDCRSSEHEKKSMKRRRKEMEILFNFVGNVILEESMWELVSARYS